MQHPSPAIKQPELGDLLRAELPSVVAWTTELNTRRAAFHVAVIVVGAGLYGAAMGWWRAPLQAAFVAIKFPLIVLSVTIGNAFINSMLAPLLGLNVGFRQVMAAILTSFAITAAILGAFSPLAAFMIWNAPPLSSESMHQPVYAFIKLVHVAVIAFAGIAGNVRLFQLLSELAKSKAIAGRVLFAWLAVNLFLGSQLTWIARPFVGAPHLPVKFLRDTAFQGNFYENVFQSTRHLFEVNN